MTLQQAIEAVRAIRSPAIPDADLIRIISGTEHMLYQKIISPRSNYDFDGYTENDLTTVLKAPPPFDEIYVQACLREVDRRENQITNENNAEREYKELVEEFAAWYLRNHRPERRCVRSWWYGI